MAESKRAQRLAPGSLASDIAGEFQAVAQRAYAAHGLRVTAVSLEWVEVTCVQDSGPVYKLVSSEVHLAALASA